MVDQGCYRVKARGNRSGSKDDSGDYLVNMEERQDMWLWWGRENDNWAYLLRVVIC